MNWLQSIWVYRVPLYVQYNRKSASITRHGLDDCILCRHVKLIDEKRQVNAPDSLPVNSVDARVTSDGATAPHHWEGLARAEASAVRTCG